MGAGHAHHGSLSDLDIAECEGRGLQHSHLLGLRLGALFGILLLSAVGVALPYYTRFARLQNFFFLLKAFAGGVVLATGFIHILGEAMYALSSSCLDFPEFPWAMSIATFSTLVTFTFEWHLHRHISKAFHEKACGDGAYNDGMCACHGELPASSQPKEGVVVKVDPERAPDDKCDEATQLMEDSTQRVMYSVQSCTLEAGIVFHSIFVGITLGLSSDRKTLESLMIALLFHQFNEGIALGLTFIQARFSKFRYILLSLTFMLTTPLGIVIGMLIAGSGHYSSKALLGVEGVFNAASAGILLYNGLVDLIVPTFNSDEDERSTKRTSLGFVALFLGAAAMAVIGRWA